VIGGAGGAGGRVDVIAHAVGVLASISTAGGTGGGYGKTQGAGGAGGAIWGWTDAPIFNAHEVVTAAGGDGNPAGADGATHQEQSPTGLTVAPKTGLASFTSRSPDAQRYRVLFTPTGGTQITAEQAAANAGLRLAVPVCKPGQLTVVAVDDANGWVSDPSPAVAYTRPPSNTQTCSKAPGIRAAATVKRTLKALKRAAFVANIKFRAAGIGKLTATLALAGKRGHRAHKLATVSAAITRPGVQTVHLHLPAGARSRGSYVLQLATTSPDGKGHATTTLRLEIT
jgi:hypothetical protein